VFSPQMRFLPVTTKDYLRHPPEVQLNCYRRVLTRSPLSPPHRERPGMTEGYFTSRREVFGRPTTGDSAALMGAPPRFVLARLPVCAIMSV
jgi:hypothetical protein